MSHDIYAQRDIKNYGLALMDGMIGCICSIWKSSYLFFCSLCQFPNGNVFDLFLLSCSLERSLSLSSKWTKATIFVCCEREIKLEYAILVNGRFIWMLEQNRKITNCRTNIPIRTSMQFNAFHDLKKYQFYLFVSPFFNALHFFFSFRIFEPLCCYVVLYTFSAYSLSMAKSLIWYAA